MPKISKLSHAIEDYIKAIYELQQHSDAVTTSSLAERLNIAPASVTGMIKKLAKNKPPLVDYTRHRGVTLTPAGEKIALEIIRHHRLIELYLMEALGYTWDEVHAEAERLEHVISEELESRIAEFLGHPTVDPHGEPIPTKEGTIEAALGARLTTLEPGQLGRVVRVRDDDPDLLRYLAELGIQPHATIIVTERAPFDGPLHVRVDYGEVQALGRRVTDSIYITVANQSG